MRPILPLRLLALLLFNTLALGVVAPGHAQNAVPDPAAPVNTAERELVVRFTRAYSMARSAFEEQAAGQVSETRINDELSEPSALERDLRREVNRIIDLNGLEEDEWTSMLARLETDEELQRRVESLSKLY